MKATPPRLHRLSLAFLVTLVAALASSSLVALGAFHNNGQDGLASVGPIASEHVFPVWFRDTAGTRLEVCLDVDSYCLLTSADLPDPTAPVDFATGNFPGEVFWLAADSFIELPSGLDAALVLALEGAFLNEAPVAGDNIVFGRVRIRVSNLQPGASYTVIHPYGSDQFIAEPDPKNPAAGEINFTEDVGLEPSGAATLNSRVGPFLRWDPAVAPAAPAGYIGDPAVPHSIVGSPYGTNYFMIRGPGVRAPGDPGICPGSNDADTSCAYTTAFALAGKYANNAGVGLDTVLYDRDSSGRTTLNIYAYSEAGQAVEFDGQSFLTTAAKADGPNYYGRISYDGAPETVTATNTSDVPAARAALAPSDQVTITRAEYDVEARTLRIEASSSDAYTNPALTLVGYNIPLVGGAVTIEGVEAPPLYATVRSAARGVDQEQIRIIGGSFAPIAVVALAGGNQSAVPGATVRLDGAQSRGEISSWQWTQVDNGAPSVSLSGADSATASFTAPSNDGDADIALQFRLTVTNAAGSSEELVTVAVRTNSTPPAADAGADQTVMRGSVVRLSGAASTNALSYAWSSSPAVALSGADTATPSFTFPQVGTPVILTLTVTGAGGATATDTVTVTPLTDRVTITSAQYTRSSATWRVRGTAAIAGQGNVATIYLSNTCSGTVLGTATVDALGDWEYRGGGAAAANNQRVSVCTLGGGAAQNFAVRIR